MAQNQFVLDRAQFKKYNHIQSVFECYSSDASISSLACPNGLLHVCLWDCG